MRIVSSRRLRGPSLAGREPGAIAEVTLEGASALEAEQAWRDALARMAAALSRAELASRASVRAFPGGLALYVPAPLDALLAATDLNEWAIEAADAALRGETLREDEREARRRLERGFRRESSPRLLALHRAARARSVPFLWDDDALTLGHAARSRTYALDRLPRVREVEWRALGAIPVALVTGTNGKTTTARLVARMAKLAGLVPGSTSSDGVAIDERIVEAGDWTGAEAARMVLRHRDVQLAVLETARGGILRRGLAVESCDAALVTNVSDDHLGEHGVCDLATMARVKAVVGHAVRSGGRVVLNAGDPELMRLAGTFGAELVLFSTSAESARELLASGRSVFVVEDGALVQAGPHGRDVLASIDEVPLTFGGAARHNVANSLAAAALAWSLDLPRDAIVRALRSFGASPDDNPGRGQVIELEGGVRALLDFGHNPAGLRELYALARTLVAPGARIHAVHIQGGDRSDDDLAHLAQAMAEGGASHVVLWESERLLRGRAPGEIRRILREALVAHGLEASAIAEADDEASAITIALATAEPGDLLLVAPHVARGQLDHVLRRAG